MRVHRYVLPAIVLVALLGSVLVGKLTGDWTTTGKGEILVDASGAPDPEGIKGWMTLQEVSDTYGIPLAELYAGLGVPADAPPTTAMKDLEGIIPDFETATARLWVANYQAEHPGAAPTSVPPTTSQGSGQSATPALSGERLAGSEIKGQMTLSEIAEQCQVPLSYLLEQMKVNASEDPGQTIKDVAGKYGFEVGTVRLLVTEYQATHP